MFLEMIDSFEKDLARTVEELKQEKEKSSEVVDKMKEEVCLKKMFKQEEKKPVSNIYTQRTYIHMIHTNTYTFSLF